MKTYKYTIVIAHTRYEETKQTNSIEVAVKAYKNGHMVIDNATDEEADLFEYIK